MSERIDSRLAVDALEMAVSRQLPEAGLIAHSDRGVQDAAILDIHIISPDGKKLANLKLTGSAECDDWGTLALDQWSQLNFPDHSKGEARFPACQRATFTIDGKDKVVRLSLNDGRRQALLERPAADMPVAAQVNAAPAQFGVTTSRQFVTGANAVSGLGGAIGFQPVITTVREGIGLSAMAVVTGERRYVRLSVAPVFSQIIGVDSFTIPSSR